MKKKQGIQLVASLIIIAVALAAGSLYYIYGGKDNVENGEIKKESGQDQEEISNKIRENLGDFSDITFTDISDNYSRVSIKKDNDQSLNVFLVKAGTEWSVVESKLSTEKISCEKMSKYNFPYRMISDCEISHPDAVTANKFVENRSSLFAEDVPVQLIGVIEIPNDPSCPGCVNITSGEETVTVTIGSDTDFSNVKDGDTVVLEISDGDSDGDPDPNVDDALDIPPVANSVDAVYSGINVGTPGQTNDTVSPDDDQGDSSDDISDYEPVSIPSDYEMNLFDIDHSSLDIQIIGDDTE